MNHIIAPLTRNDFGASIANLHVGLILLLDSNALDPRGPDAAAVERLAIEQRDRVYGEVTQELVKAFQRQYREQFDLRIVSGEQVDEATASALNRLLGGLNALPRARTDFSVAGLVEYEDGTPAVGVIVRIFDRDLGARRTVLGRDDGARRTNADGVFPQVHYRPGDIARGEGERGPNANLVFDVAEGEHLLSVIAVYRRGLIGEDSLVGNRQNLEARVADPLLGFEATAVEDVRVVVAGRPRDDRESEYSRLIAALRPLLIDANPADLDQTRFRDLDLAARETGWDRERIETMRAAWAVERESGVSESGSLAETFYGLLREGPPTEVGSLPATLVDLLARNTLWTAKLEDSLKHRVIGGDLLSHLRRLRDLRVARAAATGDGTQATAGDLLALAGIGQDDGRHLLSAYETHEGTLDAFWRDVAPEIVGTEEVRAVQEAIASADLVAYDARLVARLRDRGLTTPKAMASLARREWTDLVSSVPPPSDAPGATAEERITRAVDSIVALVEASYPTETMARLASRSRDPQLAEARGVLAGFFESEARTGAFDIRTSPVTTYLEEHGDRIYRGLDDGDRQRLATQLRRLQRVYRLGVSAEQSEALLEAGLDSAFHVTRFSPEHFLAEFSERLGGEGPASAVYGRAEYVAGTTMYVFSDVWQGLHSAKPLAFDRKFGESRVPPLKELPIYKALFGGFHLCECEHCHSFYSPAAYFVDLLHMLDRPTLADNPVEALFLRRPDIGHIQLTCENTHTPIPYVDLVNEILESFVANRVPKAFNIPPAPPNQFLVAPSAEELRVNPVYLTKDSASFADQAYDVLQETAFPLSLPLNLPLESTRTYLDHLGTSRPRLMELFDRDPGLEALMALGSEVLRLSPEEFELLSGSRFDGASALRPATTAEFFGLSEADTPTLNAKTLFNHYAPEFIRNDPSPDPRATLIRSLQNVLNLLSPKAVPVTGVFDVDTEAAVNVYLAGEGLPTSGTTDDAFWGAMEADKMPSLSVLLCPVPFFLDRTGLTYPELVALVKTRFVNPTLQGQGDFDYLGRLNVEADEVKTWLQSGAATLPAPLATKVTAGGETLGGFIAWVRARARAVVINTGLESPCDLDRTTLMHLDGTLLTVDELIALLRFVRLWRKLEWTLDEMDLALEPGGLHSSAIFNTVLLLANIKQLRERLQMPIADLVSLWHPIPAHGASALYDRLFRNRAAQLLNPILELNAERTELAAAGSATPPALSEHLPVILSAFRISAQDLAILRDATGLSDPPGATPALLPRLTLASLSTLYRRVALARVLGIPVRSLQPLVDLSALDVFERPDRFPKGQALRFVEIVDRMKALGVTATELDYLCREVPQPPGLPGAEREAWRRTLATLIAGLADIESEEPLHDDPIGEQLIARLTTLLGAADAAAAGSMIYGRDVYTAPLIGLPAGFVFPASVQDKVSYDAARQLLRYRGTMEPPDLAALLGAPGVPAPVQLDYDGAVTSLDAQPRAFVSRALRPLFTPAEAQALLVDVASLRPDGLPDPPAIASKVDAVLTRRRQVISRSLIKQTVTTSTGMAADVVALLLENSAVLTSLTSSASAIADYRNLTGTGLSGEYFPSIVLTGAATLQDDPRIAFEWKGAIPAPGIPASGFSARWTGHVYVPAAGEVTFHLRCTDGVRLYVDNALVIDEWHDAAPSLYSEKVRLDGGQFYPIVVEYYNKNGSALVELQWGSPSIGPAIVPQAALYSTALLDVLLQRIERLYKLAKLLAPFNLSAAEIQALSERGDLTLNLMPLNGPAPILVAQAMLAQWLALGRYASLRDRFSGSEVRLIDVPDAPTDAEARARFVKLTGITTATLDGIIAALTIPVFDTLTSVWSVDAPDLASYEAWSRIADAFAVVQQTGASPSQLLAWARAREIRQLPTGPETVFYTWTSIDVDGNDRTAQNRNLAQQAKDVVRSRYDEERWRAAARPLNDRLRARRSSALTGFVLAMHEMMRARVTDSGRLFEFFLIDPEMDPCMETSRIKQGISSVQLFIQRVLLDLESPRVPPSRVDRGRWDWMKTYRVWEANRKVFLYAESYCEGDFRDNKTPIFEQLESQLLQDELNDVNAERAFRQYLEKLDILGKLFVCGSTVDSSTGTLHVFGRTTNAPFAYYHRELKAPSSPWESGVWGPWRALPVDVAGTEDGARSGVHMLPIAWNRRLYLFWPIFERKPDETTNRGLPSGFETLDGWHIRLAWSEYQDGRWSPKQISLPFVQSGRLVMHNESETQTSNVYTPQNLKITTTEYIPNPIPGMGPIVIDSWTTTTTQPTVIVGNSMLSGVRLDKPGDFARLDHWERKQRVTSLLPAPADHFLDARLSGGALTVGLYCRFKGIPTGQERVETVDAAAVVHDGRRTDRTEHSQDDSPASDSEQRVYVSLGSFTFPACRADLDATSVTQMRGYNSLYRPQDTVNTFMGFTADWPRVSGLRLSSTAAPVLGFVPHRFEVNDADGRVGFVVRGPFFYQDQERCYFVTRDGLRDLLVTPERSFIYLEQQMFAASKAMALTGIANRSLTPAAGSAFEANPWAVSALSRWSAGPGVPAEMRAPATMHTLSAPTALKNLVFEEVDSHIDLSRYTRQPEYLFTTFWHPHTCPFLASLNSGGFPALFTLENQLRTDKRAVAAPPGFTCNFEAIYKPDPAQVRRPYPLEDVDFTRSGAYSIYNWELFFHAPLMVATRLSRSGQYSEALRWFHFIFDPMTSDADPSERRFWRFLPFRTADVSRIEDMLNLLGYTGADPVLLAKKGELQASIQEWLANPFRPHVIARRRPVVYMKHVFMKYLDNLIAWGDELFQRDTIESINEATQLYILAANLLGPRPERVPPPGPVAPETYQTLRTRLDELSNAQVDIETRLPFTQFAHPTPAGGPALLPTLPQTLYFCLPNNDKLMAYWDTIADRLFKIRHCMNIEGTVRQLALFEPAIDPMLLVEATAKGIDIGSVLNDLYAPLPRYRFTFTLQQAVALCNDCRALGSLLQGVLEKRDSEQLALLRAGQESRLLDIMRENKRLQIQEAEETRRSLEESAEAAKIRIQYYANLLSQGLIAEEEDQLALLDTSNARQETASWIEATAQALNLIPTFSSGSEGFSVSFGGANLGAAATAVGRSYSYLAASYAYKSNRASITGSQTRRADEWRFQRDLARRELRQIERQIAAARIRAELMRAEQRTHDAQIEHTRAVEELLRTHFTNDALYSWLEGSLRTVYFQCYRAAFDVARRAERCWRHERGTDGSFIQFGAWDSSARGLLAGERLLVQLKQMERAYLEQQIVEFELTKHVSILQLDPVALIALKETGVCEVDIPEWLFDLDFPGHYFRRLKTVSLTIPAVVGPYTSVSATLTLLRSSVRPSSRVVGAYDDEDNYRPDHLAIEAIAASSGQNDSGRFELELRDERYLPFEGAGAISRWRIELPRRFRSFDYDTITDVVLHLKYTARRDETLAPVALTSLQSQLTAAGGTLHRLFSLRHEFPNEWRTLRMASDRAATFTLSKDRFPLLVQGGAVTLVDVSYALILKEPAPTVGYTATLTPPGAAALTLSWPGQPERYRSGGQATTVPVSTTPGASGWRLQITAPSTAADLDRIQDILIVGRYSAVM
jgi:peptidoglycan hydrolase-like protein with peptidoglycan-binding domain